MNVIVDRRHKVHVSNRPKWYSQVLTYPNGGKLDKPNHTNQITQGPRTQPRALAFSC
jgi:hypothetical protein